MLCKLIQQQGAPEFDIDTFSGDHLEYHYFMEVFKEVVEKRIEDPRGRLTRLINYTTGEAKDLIKHCIQQPSAEGYENAMELLENRYGDPLKILAIYRREIKNGQEELVMQLHLDSFIILSLKLVSAIF